MTQSEFTQQYVGTFDDEHSRKVKEFADRYELGCENYDRTVCSIRNERGVAMPANWREQGLVSRNALAIRKQLVDEANECGIHWSEVQNVLRHRP